MRMMPDTEKGADLARDGFSPSVTMRRALRFLRYHRKVPAFIHDAIMAWSSFALAMGLRLGTNAFSPYYLETLMVSTALFTAIALPIFYVFRLHRQVWRYASLTDMVMIVKAATLAILTFMLFMFVFTRLDTMPRSVPIIHWGVLVILLGGPRILDRWLRGWWAGWSSGHSKARSIKVLVLGTGEEAQLFLRAIASEYAPVYRAVGILDISPTLVGRAIHGVPVLGQVGDLPAVMTRLTKRGRRPQRLIMTSDAERLPAAARGELFEQALEFSLTLARLPRLTDFKKAGAERKLEVQPIALEDLLGRPPVVLDRAAVAALIGGRRVVVTGAGGSIGGELTRQIASLGPAQLILLEQNEYNLYKIDLELKERAVAVPVVPILCDVRNAQLVNHLFAKYLPEVVFHAAALKHVPLIEANPVEGVLTNVLGTRNVADAACEHGADAMVLISTDKAVNPTSIMGASKRLAEYYCQALDLMVRPTTSRRSHFMIVRFGNVLGSSGSVVPRFQHQLAQGGPLTVTHPEIRRYFMTIPEAVELILQASTLSLTEVEERGRILVLDMGEPIRIIDIAKQIIRLAGLEPDRDIMIEFTGLRPGEKLYEELFDASETALPTPLPGVLAARPQPITLGELRAMIDALEEACARRDVAAIEAVLGEWVGGFRQSERVA